MLDQITKQHKKNFCSNLFFFYHHGAALPARVPKSRCRLLPPLIPPLIARPSLPTPPPTAIRAASPHLAASPRLPHLPRPPSVSVSLGDLAARTPSTPPSPTKPARRRAPQTRRYLPLRPGRPSSLQGCCRPPRWRRGRPSPSHHLPPTRRGLAAPHSPT